MENLINLLYPIVSAGIALILVIVCAYHNNCFFDKL